MSKDFDFDSFAKRLKGRILSGENPSKLRKWVREQMGVGKTRGNEIYAKICSEIAPEEFPQVEVVEVRDDTKFSIEDNDMTVTTTGDVTNIDDLVKYANIDLTVWEPVKQKMTIWDGKTSFHAEFKKKVEEKQFEALLENFIAEASSYAPKKWPAWKSTGGDYMYVLNIQDLHLSKLCWGKESGQDYDIKIAQQYYEDAVDDLMSKVADKKIEKIVVIVGSDFFQSDTTSSTTTKGTYVDSDSRWTKAFQDGADLMTRTIEKLASHYNVSLVQIGGNHDTSTSYYLGLYLKAWFRNNERVEINCLPSHRKYESFGNTLVGFTHGDSMKLADLPLVMMRENQEVISQYKWLEFITGHLHQEKQIELKGIKVRVSPALCPPDSWHDKNNFSFNIQTSQGLLYSRHDGLEAIFYSKPVN